MKLVGKLKLAPIDDSITDVAYLKGHAYLGTWVPLCPSEEDPDGRRRGTHIVDVRNPSNPKKVGFAETGPDAYVSEGVHVFHMKTESFTGDVLLQDRESCGETLAGGFDLYNVTNPKNPRPLVMGAGDLDSDNDGVPDQEAANDYHSVMGWMQGGSAYAVGVDNFEASSFDVDIFDISDPRNPVLIKETGLPDWPAATSEGLNNNDFHHDMWVQKVNGRWELLASYWDVGYVRLDITDPANPVFIDDTDFTSPDPEFPDFSPPEGNAHQAEWSRNGDYILAADEDFSPTRGIFSITTGPNAGEYPGGEFGFTPPAEDFFPDGLMNGPTVWGGRLCPAVADDPETPEDESQPADPSPPAASEVDVELAEDEELVLVVTRGQCFFSEKIARAEELGYTAVVIGNHHSGAQNGDTPDAYLCGSQASEIAGTAAAACTGHRAMHLIFGDEPTYEGPDDGSDIEAALGTVGEKVLLETEFDGWGYIHIFDSQTLEELDTYAIPQAKRERLRDVFPLSVHEVETDPRMDKRMFYSAYYQGGARVFKYSRAGIIREVGHYIRKGGADYWGVQPVPRGKKRPLILLSDRHFGLHIMKYTGKE